MDYHIVIAHYNEDLSWVTNLKYPFTIISKNGIPEGTQPNKGREASTYLEYIIKNYDSLHEYTFFLHGHRSSWHHKKNVDEKINKTVCLLPYYNINDFRVYRFSECQLTLSQMQASYPIVEDILGPMDVERASFRHSAQFYVHKSAILSRPLETYKALYDIIMTNTNRSFEDSLLFERIWHFIFTHDIEASSVYLPVD